ncbi:dipeptidase [Brevibacillus humidisoli]|uniref:dipeptidase n=1 Tax=Brevibacillus humidisoli TaxID=2895522 RepID=UPI001E3DFD3C|nr:dipeptidase [Brevibacillus humidisoli]UFJ42214.1 dipeptidase [Brevibacillus humidisoli]
MKLIDAHCDVLLKLWQDPSLSFGEEHQQLEANLPRLQRGEVQIQGLAIWVPSELPYGRRLEVVFEMIDVYQQQVARHMPLILSRTDLDEKVLSGQKGAILFIEGAQPIENNLANLRVLYRLGVRGIGLTWNYRNQVADGCLEPRPGGLSSFGRELITEMNRLGMIIDVSHLAEPGYWDVLEHSQQPVIASHANTRHWYDHPRNLSDKQIKGLIEKGGVLGLTFVPYFLTSEKRTVCIDDLLRHLEHVCSLGGVDHVAFGSDFDGISVTFGDLTDAGQYQLLVEELLKRYKEEEVKKFVSKNWLRVFRNVLQ